MTELGKLKMQPPKILLMGTFGTGKTLWTCSLGEKALVIDLDNGLRSAATYQDKLTSKRKLIDVKTCWEDNPLKATAFMKALSYIRTVADECRKGTFKRQALIIDGYTTLADASVRDVMARNGMLGQQPQIQHWGLAFGQLEALLLELRALPIVVVLIAHVRRVIVDEISKFEISSPGQKLPNKIPCYFDEVWMTEIKGSGNNQKYVCKTTGTSIFPCRTRGNIGNELDMNEDFSLIMEKLGHKWQPIKSEAAVQSPPA